MASREQRGNREKKKTKAEKDKKKNAPTSITIFDEGSMPTTGAMLARVAR